MSAPPPYTGLEGNLKSFFLFLVLFRWFKQEFKCTDFESPPLRIHNVFYADLGVSFTLNLAQLHNPKAAPQPCAPKNQHLLPWHSPATTKSLHLLPPHGPSYDNMTKIIQGEERRRRNHACFVLQKLPPRAARREVGSPPARSACFTAASSCTRRPRPDVVPEFLAVPGV